MVKRKPRRADPTPMLIGLVSILSVILVLVLFLAFREEPTAPTEPTGQIQNTTQQTTVPDATTGQSGPVLSLMVSQPAQPHTVVMEPSFLFQGTSDPEESLTLNGKELVRQADGSFREEVILERGQNRFTLVHKDRTVEYTVEYRYAVQSYAPAGEQTFNSGATIRFEVLAREGSAVQVDFNGVTLSLSKSQVQEGTGAAEGFCCFEGKYVLPNTNTEDLDLGSITYTVTCDNVTETYTSGVITCLKTNDILASDPSVTPSGGKYINVGSGYIGEIVGFSAETFDGRTTDDYSHPTNNYLPQGTVDYCSTKLIEKGNLKYVLLRSGHRVYLDKKNIPSSKRVQVTDRYVGTLPDHNEIGVSSFKDTGSHLVLTLDTLWKAPFFFDLKPQDYYYPNGGSDRNYSVTALTATYIDITFCYATVFTGEVELPAGNSLFSKAELIRNESDHTLRLHLKKVGGFYGWNAYYNDAGQLCFRFLKPAKVTKAENAYGVDLSGVTVMLDVGHGGVDGGAVGVDANGKQVEEADRNLALAMALKQELESIGATVILNREDDRALNVDERLRLLQQVAPDICICLHHNSVAGYPNINGLEVFYYHPFSERAAELIAGENKKDSVYKSVMLNWHYYFVARQTDCPVVLMENGYMSSAYDVANTLSQSAILQKAQAMTRGVAAWFLELNP